MAIYAYADETVFDINTNSGIQGIGYGVFITHDEITDEFITNALISLKNDPEINWKSDIATIERGYFHACEDSANGHSHLCTAIRQHLRGIFDFSYSSIDQPTVHNKQERLLNRCLSNSSLEFFNSLEEVHLVLEGRTALKAQYVEQWQEKIYGLLEGAVYHQPSFKTFFPKINVTVADKMCPGLQVADFMSWAASRSLKQPESPKWKAWFQRIGFDCTSFASTENSTYGSVKGFLNESIEDIYSSYPHKFIKSETNEDVINAYILIERFMWQVDRADFTSETQHLFEDFQKASRLCQSLSPLRNEDFRFIARVFIRLFDSLPLYRHVGESRHEEWKCLFYAKEVATLLIYQGYIHTGRTQDYIQRWRYDAVSNHKEDFIFAMKN